MSAPVHPIEFEAAEVATAGMRDLETALALATHQCAALAAGVEATIGQALTDLNAAVANAEARLEAAAARAVELIEQAAAPRPPALPRQQQTRQQQTRQQQCCPAEQSAAHGATWE